MNRTLVIIVALAAGYFIGAKWPGLLRAIGM